MYESIIVKIEERKKQIQNKVQMRFWNNDISCSGDYADDIYLNKLYEKLERLIKNDEFVQRQREKRGETLKELSRRYNISLNTLENRVYNLRWSIDRALTTPIDTTKKVIHF